MINDKISIITVVYNDVKNIEKSIRNTLAQTYTPLELIVIDGGSTDGTVDIIKKYEGIIKWISEPDRGIYDAMKKGIKLASGKWLLFHNCGDFFISPTSISDLLFNYQDKGETFIVANIRCFNNFGYKDEKPNILSRTILDAMPVYHPATFIRTSWQKDNEYDISYKNSADYDFFIKSFKKHATYCYIDYTLVLFDCRDGATASHYDRTLMDNIIILSKYKASDIRIKTLKKELSHFYTVKWLCKYIPFMSKLRDFRKRKLYKHNGWIKKTLNEILDSLEI